MEQTYFFAFTWFVAGAVLALVTRFIINFSQQKTLNDAIIANLFYLIRGISREVQAAIYLKHEAIKLSDVPDNVVKSVTSKDIEDFKKWKKNIILFLLTSLPKSYYIYLKNRFSSHDEMILYFSKLADERQRDKK